MDEMSESDRATVDALLNEVSDDAIRTIWKVIDEMIAGEKMILKHLIEAKARIAALEEKIGQPAAPLN